jgi:hypothetical protein
MDALDRARFAKFVKCRAMMERGATAGERAAGAAAAARVAAAAGLSLAEALRLTGGPSPRPSPRPSPAEAPPHRPRAWEKPPLRADPIGVEEILAQKARTEARRKRAAARAARERRAAYAAEAAERAVLRAAQDARDRAWAEARAGDEEA